MHINCLLVLFTGRLLFVELLEIAGWQVSICRNHLSYLPCLWFCGRRLWRVVGTCNYAANAIGCSRFVLSIVHSAPISGIENYNSDKTPSHRYLSLFSTYVRTLIYMYILYRSKILKRSPVCSWNDILYVVYETANCYKWIYFTLMTITNIPQTFYLIILANEIES